MPIAARPTSLPTAEPRRKFAQVHREHDQDRGATLVPSESGWSSLSGEAVPTLRRHGHEETAVAEEREAGLNLLEPLAQDRD